MLQVLSTPAKNICKEINLSNMAYKHFGATIRFKNYDSVERYHYNSSSDEHVAFYYNATILFNCFKLCLNNWNRSNIYIASCENTQVNIKDFPVLNAISKQNKVLFTNDMNIIEEVFIKALKTEFSPIFVTESLDIAIIPTDHLDIFIASKRKLKFEELCLSPLLEITIWE